MSDWRGGLRKMQVELGETVRYRLFPEQGGLCLNESLGQSIRLSFTGAIHCVACDRLTKKSFNQGYCFPCLRKLAACDSCIVRRSRQTPSPWPSKRTFSGDSPLIGVVIQR